MNSIIDLLDKVEEIRDITDEILRIKNVYLLSITKYDNEMTYDNEPNTFKVCPHCESDEYIWLKEVLEDAILKVRCVNCSNKYYREFGK